MTERDTFAAAALTGLLANPTLSGDGMEKPAQLFYAWADAMLAARGDKRTAPAADALFHAALVLYEAGRWVSPDVPAVQAVAMWATLRDALGLPAGYATDRGVADAPPAADVTLTDAERRELEAAASDYERGGGRIVYGRQTYLRRAATIRGLLSRASSPDRMTKAPGNVTETIQEGDA
jgi:hypothetical protein